MHEFMELLNYIWSAIMDADTMACEAVENKHAHADLAAAYYRVASDRLTDADILMKQAEAYMEHEFPEDEADQIAAVWTADHGRLIKRIAHTKIKMDMYR